MQKFVPVKITDRKWAEKLLQGEVFMRPLYEFGTWKKPSGDTVLDNNYRGDIYSGATKVFSDPSDYEFLKGFPAQFRDSVDAVTLIDQSDVRFFKIFSLYCYEYDPKTDSLIKPDPRMAQFGNTAVIITDFCEFIDRFARAIDRLYPHYSVLADQVQFFDLDTTKDLNPMFSKHISQAYQKELRMAVCEIEHDEFAIGPGAEDAYRIIEDLNPLKLEIGPIQDICITMPINQFIDGWLPPGFRCRWPMNDFPKAPSIFELLLADTRKAMKNYHSILVKPLLRISGKKES